MNYYWLNFAPIIDPIKTLKDTSHEFFRINRKRYSTKNYNADKTIPQEKIEHLKEILSLTPSSINIQP
jgi:hypothetical protein